MNDPLRVHVELGERSHDVQVGRGATGAAASGIADLARGRPLAALIDAHVASLHGERLARTWGDAGIRVQRIPLPAGEAAKTMAVVEHACRRLAELGVERGDASRSEE